MQSREASLATRPDHHPPSFFLPSLPPSVHTPLPLLTPLLQPPPFFSFNPASPPPPLSPQSIGIQNDRIFVTSPIIVTPRRGSYPPPLLLRLSISSCPSRYSSVRRRPLYRGMIIVIAYLRRREGEGEGEGRAGRENGGMRGRWVKRGGGGGEIAEGL